MHFPQPRWARGSARASTRKSFALALLVAHILMGCAPGLTNAASIAAPEAAARLDHLSLQVSDVDRSASFYRDLFLLKEIAFPVPGLRWLDVGGGVQLHLLPGRKSPAVTERAAHLAFSVQDMDGLLAKLSARNVSWTDFAGTPGAVSLRRDGVRQIYLQDPDNHWIEVNDSSQ